MTAHPTDPRRILMVRGGDHRWVRHDRALLRALQLGGHTVVDLDLGHHPTAVPTPFTEPAPTRPVDLRALDRLVDRARPDLVGSSTAVTPRYLLRGSWIRQDQGVLTGRSWA